MEIEYIIIIALVVGFVILFAFGHSLSQQAMLEIEKEEFLKEQFARESCSIQSFYELNFDLCYKAGVKP